MSDGGFCHYCQRTPNRCICEDAPMKPTTPTEVDQLRAVVRVGWELSTCAAAIHWDGGRNLPSWLADLRSRIETFQAVAAPYIAGVK